MRVWSLFEEGEGDGRFCIFVGGGGVLWGLGVRRLGLG